MKPVPAVPTFTLTDMAPLQALDWTDKQAAGKAIKGLQVIVEGNSDARSKYMSEALAAAKERVMEMQTSLSFGKKATKDTSAVNTDALLKTARDEVKQLMTESTAVEGTFFKAMASFRGVGNLDFAGAFAPLLKQLRTSVQNADKSVAAVPGQIKALEGFASGLIKEIRVLRGGMANDMETLNKMKAAADKAALLAKDISTNLTKMDSTTRQMKGKLAQLPGAASELDTLATDFTVRYKKFYTGMGGIVQLKQSVETMGKSITGHGFGSSIKEVEGAISKTMKDLLAERDVVDKALKALRKEKTLPPTVKKELPEDLKA